MLAVMASRGPDGTHTWSGDRITLGHGALHATPEAVGEQMPLADPLTGNVIVADVRLDNRPELLTELGADGQDASQIGDGRLLLDAYRTWGEDCVDHLLGDFAFAIWDERRHQLFLARDHFGAKPLTYHSSEHLFAFASDSRSVIGLEDVPGTINRDRVFDFLVGATEWGDTTSTFFAAVHRLAPAHTSTITDTSERVRRYWNLPEPTPLRLRSDAEYEEAAREVLGLAVACRLRGEDAAGVLLSGGIDSASVTSMALDHGPLHAYSAVSNDDGCVETALIRSMESALPIETHLVDRSSVRHTCGDFADVQRARESLFTNGAMLRTLYSTAAADGRRSLLSGMLADEVVAISPVVAMRCFVADRQPLELARLVLADGNIRAMSSRIGLARSAISSTLAGNRRFEDRLASRRAERWEAWKRQHLDGVHLRLDPEEKVRLDHRLDATPWTLRAGDGPGSLRHRLFDSGYGSTALERYDRSAAACSIESRSPYMDRRVVEFFQRLPARQLVAAGWTKSVVRRSMLGRLPPEVVWSRHTRHLGWSFTLEWFTIDAETYLRDLPSAHALHEYVDVASLLSRPFGDDESPVDRYLPAVSLGLWLEGMTC